MSTLAVPSSPELYGFYERVGYKAFAGIDELCAVRADTSVKLTGTDPKKYAALRRDMLPLGSVIEEGECLEYLSLDAELYAGEDFLLAARGKGKELFGIELLGNTGAAGAILTALGYERGVFRTPGTQKRFAMRFPLVKGAPVPKYFGLAFD